MNKPVIVCIDDEKIVLDSLKAELQSTLNGKFDLEIAESGEEAIELIEDIIKNGNDVPLVISDQIMPGMKGDVVLMQIHHLSPDTLSILLTGQAAAEDIGNAINNANLYRYVPKPWEAKDLSLTVSQAIKTFFQGKQIDEQSKELESVVDELREINASLEKRVEERVKEVKDKNMEIEKQHKELAAAYLDMNIVSDIGKEITTCLSTDDLIDKVYENLNALMDAPSFAIGVYDSKTNTLNFAGIEGKGAIEEEKKIVHGTDSLDNKDILSAQCFLNQEEVFIHDYEKEHLYFNAKISGSIKNIPQSIIYLPLVSQGVKIGVITIQSSKKYVYEERHLAILQTLSAYIATALDNTFAHQEIKDQNIKITDSIRYAQTIQQAVLPSESKLEKTLKDHFIIYRSKDIVSGDFYWYTMHDDKIFIATVDCTGHGVPGAFMSMIGSIQLNEIVVGKGIHSPSDILTMLNKRIIDALKQEEQGENVNDDGMDICLCRLEKLENAQTKVTFSGAKTKLLYFTQEDNQINRLSGDNKSIGGKQKDSKHFNNHEIILNDGDALYLATDGIVDQNSPEGKKFGTKKLLEVLDEVKDFSMQAQKIKIESAIDQFQQRAPQRDDITVWGVRI